MPKGDFLVAASGVDKGGARWCQCGAVGLSLSIGKGAGTCSDGVEESSISECIVSATTK